MNTTFLHLKTDCILHFIESFLLPFIEFKLINNRSSLISIQSPLHLVTVDYIVYKSTTQIGLLIN